MPALAAEGVTIRHRGAPGALLTGVDLHVPRGRVTTLVGVNGCGKSSLLRVLAGTDRPAAGHVLLGGRPLGSLGRRAAARELAVVHQGLPEVPGLHVADFVDQGRYSRAGMLGMLGPAHADEVERVLRRVGLGGHGDRELDGLSGGERQRARIACALVQRPRVLLLDEPTAHLDLRHQFAVLALVRDLVRADGLTVLMVLHDLDHAMRYSDRLAVLDSGAVAAVGPPGEVVTAELVERVFGVRARVAHDGRGAGPALLVDAPVVRS